MRIHSVRLQHLSLLEEIQLRCFRTLTSEIKVKKKKNMMSNNCLFFCLANKKETELVIFNQYQTVITT